MKKLSKIVLRTVLVSTLLSPAYALAHPGIEQVLESALIDEARASTLRTFVQSNGRLTARSVIKAFSLDNPPASMTGEIKPNMHFENLSSIAPEWKGFLFSQRFLSAEFGQLATRVPAPWTRITLRPPQEICVSPAAIKKYFNEFEISPKILFPHAGPGPAGVYFQANSDSMWEINLEAHLCVHSITITGKY